jgi:hypothetical protein
MPSSKAGRGNGRTMIVGRDDTILYGRKYTRNVVRIGLDSIRSRNPHIHEPIDAMRHHHAEDVQACSGTLSPRAG